MVITSAAIWQLQRSDYFWRNPLEGAKVTRLTDFEGAEHHAAISRDGNFVVFLSDRDGRGTFGSPMSGLATPTTSPEVVWRNCEIPGPALSAFLQTARW